MFSGHYIIVSFVNRLHLLTEIEECFRVLTDLKTEVEPGDNNRISPADLLKNWDSRLQVMQVLNKYKHFLSICSSGFSGLHSFHVMETTSGDQYSNKAIWNK
jgi:hypothetical protein